MHRIFERQTILISLCEQAELEEEMYLYTPIAVNTGAANQRRPTSSKAEMSPNPDANSRNPIFEYKIV